MDDLIVTLSKAGLGALELYSMGLKADGGFGPVGMVAVRAALPYPCLFLLLMRSWSLPHGTLSCALW